MVNSYLRPHDMVGKGGLEPPKHEAEDLQSPGIAAIRLAQKMRSAVSSLGFVAVRAAHPAGLPIRIPGR